LLLIDRRENNIERLIEPTQKLILPLDRKRGGTQDQDALDCFAQLHFFYEQAGHDCFTGTRIVGKQKPKTRLRQHP